MKIEILKKWIAESDNIVFSAERCLTESGIPDFRSVDGLYNQKYDYPPEMILSHSFFINKPEEFYRFYHDKMIIRGAKPNRAHIRLAELEREGKLKAVITQNVDGLHQMAGSQKVLELHGSIHRNYCMRCSRRYGYEAVSEAEGVPNAAAAVSSGPMSFCIKRASTTTISEAVTIRHADVLIIGGTSLVAYPGRDLSIITGNSSS